MDIATKYQLIGLLWWLVANTQPKGGSAWFELFLRILAGIYMFLAAYMQIRG